MSDFWTSRLRTRRKAHNCETCGAVVPIGSRSFDEGGTIDGDMISFKQCAPCRDIVRYFYWRGTLGYEGYQLSELGEIARDEGLTWPPVVWSR